MSTRSTLILGWYCKYTWSGASKNTLWYLLSCCMGDFGAIGFLQFMDIDLPVSLIMILAIINVIITSVILETTILSKQMLFKLPFMTAIGMSLVSKISIKAAIN